MLSTDKSEVLSELDKVQRRRGELWCELEEMKRATKHGYPPSYEEEQDYRTRKNEVEAEYKALRERLHEIMRSESKQSRQSKPTPPAERPRAEAVKTVKRLF